MVTKPGLQRVLRWEHSRLERRGIAQRQQEETTRLGQ